MQGCNKLRRLRKNTHNRPNFEVRWYFLKIVSMIWCVSSKTPSDMMPKRDHERDVELDKKIEALRRKNEALMKRYKVRTSAYRQKIQNLTGHHQE